MSAVDELLGDLRRIPLPDVVYHHTSPGGLLGMLGKRVIWATDVRYLNDSQEFQYTLDFVQPIIAQARDASPDETDRMVCGEFLRALEVAPDVRVYAASFSARADLLSQWRAYCPASGGFAVGFTSEILSESTQCPLLPCIYDEEEQRRLARRLIQYLLDQHRARPKEQEEPEEFIGRVGLGVEFLGGVVFLAGVYKHPGFDEEREWRLIYRGEVAPRTAPSFREGRSGIVPFVPLGLERSDGGVRIDEVVVGPNPHAALAEDAVRAFLDVSGVRHDGVRQSRIPFRSW